MKPNRNLKLENDPTVGSLVYELNLHKTELIKAKEEAVEEVKDVLSEVKNTLSTKTSEVDEAISTLEQTTVEIIEHVKTISKGEKGEDGKDGADGKDGDTPKIDEDKIAEKVIRLIPESKPSLKIIQESIDIDLVVEKLEEKTKDKLFEINKINGLSGKLDNITRDIARKTGYSGGGDTVAAGSGITITTNSAGAKVIATSGAGTGTVTSIATAGLISGGTITTTGTITTSIATNKLVGRSTAGTGVMEEITLGTGLAFTGTTLNVTGGTGDVVGPASSTDNAVARYDSTTGKLIQNSGVTISDTNVITTAGTIDSSLTASEILGTNGSKQLVSLAVATYPSLTELTYVKGVTSAIQTQINTKAPSTSPTFATSITGSYLTASEILITDGSKNIVSAAVATYPSLTELTYLKGVTSAIQTQLNAKGAGTVTSVGFTGGIISIADPTTTPAFTVAGTSGGIPYFSGATTWATSAALAASAIVIGGGAGVAPSTTTTGTGVLTALGVNVGSAGAFVTFNGALGTPSSGTVTNLTGTASININGTVGATTPTTGVFTTATINTGLVPDADDGAYLGQAGTAFSDLFLAEGAVINWDSGDATITQTGNVLAVAGADLRVATAGVGTDADSVPTLSSTSTLTNKTLTSPTLTTPSAFTTGGTITLAENTSIALDPTLSADGTYTGVTIAGTAGATLAFGDLVYLAVADSRWELVDADAVATAGAVLTGMCVLAAASDGSATTILLHGNIRADANFPALTVGAPVYASTTPGDVQTTAPSGEDDIVVVLGYALTADSMFFSAPTNWIVYKA